MQARLSKREAIANDSDSGLSRKRPQTGFAPERTQELSRLNSRQAQQPVAIRHVPVLDNNAEVQHAHGPNLPPSIATEHPRKRQSANTHPKKLARAMSRATARATRYCTSYIQKGQPAGKREVARALRNLDFLEASLSKEEAVKQFMRTANRVLLDIQFKGAVRPTTEEFRLAA